MTQVASDDPRVSELIRELHVLRGRQEAVADVLRALARSGMRLQPILDQIVEAAARLCADSCLIRILLSQRAYAALEEQVEAEPVADLQVKGFARPVQAYALSGLVA